MKKNEQDLRHLWDTIKCISERIMGIPEAEEKREKLFKETVSEHLPNLVTIINLYVQEAQQIPSRKKSKRSTPRHYN